MGVLEVGRIGCSTWSISGVWPGERLPICSSCDRALSDGERQGASGSLLDLLIGTLFATMAAWGLGGGGDRRSPAGGSLGSR